MWNSRLLSRRCCGGPVLAMSLLCISLGGLFLSLAATSPGLVFVSVGALMEALCLILSRSRCPASFKKVTEYSTPE